MIARRGIIASAILRPVVEVLVSPGDRVTKGQPLIKLYDLEPQAKVRARANELRSAEAKAQASRRNLELAERSQQSGAIPQTTYNELRGTALSNDALVVAAQAELALAQSELKLYTLNASMDGEVAWLDVSPGTVSWPGSLIWGEIVDLRELDVRCDLTPAQADQVAVGKSAEVWLDGKAEAAGTGKVVFVGQVADRNSGFVPVVVRVANAQERLARRLSSRSASKRSTRSHRRRIGRETLASPSRTCPSTWSRQPRAGPPRYPVTRPGGARGTRRPWGDGGIRLGRRRAPLVRFGGAGRGLLRKQGLRLVTVHDGVCVAGWTRLMIAEPLMIPDHGPVSGHQRAAGGHVLVGGT